MAIPRIPTDNLYKFMALTGVLLLIGSFLIVWFLAERSQVLFRQYKQGAALIEAKLEIARLQDLLDKEAYKSSKHSREVLGEAKMDRARLTEIEEELKFILEWKPTYRAFFIIASLVGSILCVVGFRLWYTRVQKYQDMILLNQAFSGTGGRLGSSEESTRQIGPAEEEA